MSDLSTSVNFASLERKLNQVINATNAIESQVAGTNNRINQVSAEVGQLNKELAQLRSLFESYMDDSKRNATLQKAATELIRVRQEMEQNFGNYQVVRETMLGVLQATDLALVKKTTISQVTEELMLSTPDYWLAPCLIAVAAWIGNDRDLANRAIKEAIKRDEEKTALTMALICRRNNRKDTCFQWLSIYFAKQSAANFTESNFTYLNAYLNGVFGTDEKHMCEDYVAKWMREMQGQGEEFEKKQTQLWRNYCENFTVDLEGQFPQMSAGVTEYGQIIEYVRRINSVGQIKGNFHGIQNRATDDEKLKKDIDQTLINLISRYDDKEEPLRKEERYLQAIRYFNGDTDAAKRAVLEADRKRTEETIDLVSQMTNIIIKRKDTHPSECRTAVSFLSVYIRDGFRSYITEKKEEFPQQITLNVEGWTGTTTDGMNADELHNSFETQMIHEKRQQIQQIRSDLPKERKPLSTLAKVLLCVFFPVGIGYWLYTTMADQKTQNIEAMVQDTEADYTRKINDGNRKIDDILAEWKSVKDTVEHFESEDIPDVVA